MLRRLSSSYPLISDVDIKDLDSNPDKLVASDNLPKARKKRRSSSGSGSIKSPSTANRTKKAKKHTDQDNNNIDLGSSHDSQLAATNHDRLAESRPVVVKKVFVSYFENASEDGPM